MHRVVNSFTPRLQRTNLIGRRHESTRLQCERSVLPPREAMACRRIAQYSRRGLHVDCHHAIAQYRRGLHTYYRRVERLHRLQT